MVSDTRPRPHQIEVTSIRDSARRFVNAVANPSGAEACAQSEHVWTRWIEQSFTSLDQVGPIYACARCGVQRRGIP